LSEAAGVLVIGGGIAGIQAALDVAEQGVQVYLVEKSPTIGGHMAMLDKTFPTLDCSACILTPKMVEVVNHPKIKLLTYSEVQRVRRNKYSFEVEILKKPRFVDETKCIGCGICAQHCPIEVPNEFDVGLGIRKAIYVPFPQAVPLKYTIDEKHCMMCELCRKVCNAEAVNFNQKPEIISLTVEAVIIATGFEMFDAKKKSEYGYGRYPNVITNLELERLLNASGPTGGHILRLSDGRIPRRVAFIQCAGSRDRHLGYPNCSRVCCLCSIKNGILLKEHVKNIDVTIFYMDIRAGGKGSEEFYQRAKDEFNLHFIRGRVGRVIEIPKTNNLLIRAEDTETGELIDREFDMVILAVGMKPSSEVFELSKILDVTVDEDGFVQDNDKQTNPIATKAQGIFVAGAAHGPKDIPDSVIEASAAAMKAVTFLKNNGYSLKKTNSQGLLGTCFL
jgi:heterodisulfide reductase subunit A